MRVCVVFVAADSARIVLRERCHRSSRQWSFCRGPIVSSDMEYSMKTLEQQFAMASFGARRRAFRALHEAGCFVMPNPWDVGTARYLQHLGFAALATTSAGFAFSEGLPDSGDEAVLSRDRNLAHIADITAAVDLPV